MAAASTGGALSFPAALPDEMAAPPVRDKSLPERLVNISLLCDTAIIVYALVASFWIRFHSSIAELGVPDDLTIRDYAGYIAFGSLALVLMLTARGVYERNALLRLRSVSLEVLKACSLWAGGFLAVSLALKFHPPISRIYVLIASVMTPALLLWWRWVFHSLVQHSNAAASLRQRILFVGWNEESEKLSNHFSSDTSSAYNVIGCIGSGRARFQRRPQGVKVLGRYAELVDVIHQHGIDMVVLTDLTGMKDEIVSLANTCEREMVTFKVIPSYFQILVSGLHLETVSGIPILGVSRLPLDRFTNQVLKRIVDIIGATVGLILSSPIIAIFGAIVYWESPGPIFYRQRRIGLGGREFDILKIRSMRLDAEKDGRAGWTTKNDPRRLRVGGFMRKWNIDEVPQFWNVLMGHMSLVGPRPERPELIMNFKHEIPHYNARHNAIPGITGWAQVNGLRGDTDLTERIKCDLWYLENWSLMLDLQIMFMTFFKRDNAC